MLHGWGTTSDIWQTWLVILKEHFSIMCIDLPGLGLSVATADAMDLNNVVSEFERMIPAKSVLLGWSLGGLLSILIAQRLQHKISALITIACNPCFVQSVDWKEAMPMAVFDQFAGELANNKYKTLKRFFMLQVKTGSASKLILSRLKEINSSAEHSQLILSLDYLRLDVRAALKNLALPSLHFYAEQDQLVPIKVSDKVFNLSSNIVIYKIPKAGHLPFLSDANLMLKVICDFLPVSTDGRF
jgi:pimeloyl-ACP methyl ester esterase